VEGSGFFEGLCLKGTPVRTEQSATPMAFAPYPQGKDLGYGARFLTEIYTLEDAIELHAFAPFEGEQLASV
jgi:hypothetical protein